MCEVLAFLVSAHYDNKRTLPHTFAFPELPLNASPETLDSWSAPVRHSLPSRKLDKKIVSICPIRTQAKFFFLRNKLIIIKLRRWIIDNRYKFIRWNPPASLRGRGRSTFVHMFTVKLSFLDNFNTSCLFELIEWTTSCLPCFFLFRLYRRLLPVAARCYRPAICKVVSCDAELLNSLATSVQRRLWTLFRVGVTGRQITSYWMQWWNGISHNEMSL